MSDVDRRFKKCPHGYYLIEPSESFDASCLCPHGCGHVAGQEPQYVVFDETPLLPVTMVTSSRQAAEEMYRFAEALIGGKRTWWQRFLLWLGYAPRAHNFLPADHGPFDFDAEESMVVSDGGGGSRVVPPEGIAVGPMHGVS